MYKEPRESSCAAVSRLEAGSDVGVGDAERSAVVLLILYRHPATIRFLVCKQRRGVESLVVDQRSAVSSLATGFMVAAEWTDRAYTFAGTAYRAEQHGMSHAVVAGASVDVQRLVEVLFCDACRSGAREQASLAQHTGVSPRIMRSAACGCCCIHAFCIVVALPSSP